MNIQVGDLLAYHRTTECEEYYGVCVITNISTEFNEATVSWVVSKRDGEYHRFSNVYWVLSSLSRSKDWRKLS